MLEHGGQLRLASARHDIPLEQWLDLSTGINANGWPVPAIPASAWARLPEADDGLEAAAQEYYGTEHVLPVAGSQAAIQALPTLRQPCRVGVPDPGYAEHAHAWRRYRHQVRPIPDACIDQAIADLDVLIVIQPNNPTGTVFPPTQILDWHAQLAQHGGWLVVDEAFMDSTPAQSLAVYCTRPGLIVLRSLGKFFGLAGARVGFFCTQAELLARMSALLGPWTICSAARWVASATLKDRLWQESTRLRLLEDSARLHALLSEYGLAPDGGCPLFQWSRTPLAVELHQHFAGLGILTRLFVEPCSLRLSVPGNEADWERLDAALTQVTGSNRAEFER